MGALRAPKCLCVIKSERNDEVICNITCAGEATRVRHIILSAVIFHIYSLLYTPESCFEHIKYFCPHLRSTLPTVDILHY